MVKYRILARKLLAFLLIVGCESIAMARDRPVIYDIINHIVESRLKSASEVERVIGNKLTYVENSVPYHYEAHGVKVRGISIKSLQYWEPSTFDGEGVGPHLDFVIEGCLRRRDVERHYGPWNLVGIPGPEGSWGKQEPWGSLMFGAEAGNPACIKTISIDMRGKR